MQETGYIQENNNPPAEYLSYAWGTAIGLQKVDQLTPSQYLIDTAKQNIEGKITLDEAEALIHSYYAQERKKEQQTTYEADIVSTRITKIISGHGFSLTPVHYLAIHKQLFEGIYKNAGKVRDYNISKKEWVLDGASVYYGPFSELKETLKYDLAQEKSFSYKGLDKQQTIKHLSQFVSALWQNHVFGEGNTRTTAVFFIEYLRTLGYAVTNQSFEKNSWYFRNALVRANYNNIKQEIYATTEYLELFLENLLLNKNHELKNRTLHVRYTENKRELLLDGLRTAFERYEKDGSQGVCGDWKIENDPSSLWKLYHDEKPVASCEAEQNNSCYIKRLDDSLSNKTFSGICEIAHFIFPKCQMTPKEQETINQETKGK